MHGAHVDVHRPHCAAITAVVRLGSRAKLSAEVCEMVRFHTLQAHSFAPCTLSCVTLLFRFPDAFSGVPAVSTLKTAGYRILVLQVSGSILGFRSRVF